LLLRVAERQPDPWLDLCKTHLPINVPRQRRALGGGLTPRERPRASQVPEGRLSTSKTLRQLTGWTGRGPLPPRARRRAWVAAGLRRCPWARAREIEGLGTREEAW